MASTGKLQRDPATGKIMRQPSSGKMLRSPDTNNVCCCAPAVSVCGCAPGTHNNAATVTIAGNTNSFGVNVNGTFHCAAVDPTNPCNIFFNNGTFTVTANPNGGGGGVTIRRNSDSAILFFGTACSTAHTTRSGGSSCSPRTRGTAHTVSQSIVTVMRDSRAQVDGLGGRVRRQDVNLGELATVGDFDAKLGTADRAVDLSPELHRPSPLRLINLVVLHRLADDGVCEVQRCRDFHHRFAEVYERFNVATAGRAKVARDPIRQVCCGHVAFSLIILPGQRPIRRHHRVRDGLLVHCSNRLLHAHARQYR
jgi:hypothetical protein